MLYDCDKTASTHHYQSVNVLHKLHISILHSMFLLDNSNSLCLVCIILLSFNCYHHEDQSLPRCYILLLGKSFPVFQTIVQPSSSGSGLKEIMKMKTLQSLEVLWTAELTAQRNILDDLNLQQHHGKNIRSSMLPIHSHYLIKWLQIFFLVLFLSNPLQLPYTLCISHSHFNLSYIQENHVCYQQIAYIFPVFFLTSTKARKLFWSTNT